MGNCLARLAFKPEDEEEEYKCERTRPEIPIRTSSLKNKEVKKTPKYPPDEVDALFNEAMQGMFDNIFEPRSSGAVFKKGINPESVKINVSVGPVTTEVKNGTKEGVMKAIAELKHDLSQCEGWINKSAVFTSVQETKTVTERRVKSPRNVNNKAAKRRLRRQQRKARNRLARLKSFEDISTEEPKVDPQADLTEISTEDPNADLNSSAGSIIEELKTDELDQNADLTGTSTEEPKTDELDQIVSESSVLPTSDKDKKLAKNKLRFAKRLLSFKVIKPLKRFKYNVKLMNNGRLANIPNQYGRGVVLVKAEASAV